MNDRKFLGLLNLYLDGEIDPESAAGLEREIVSNPQRREVYSQYCRIHRATKLVYERFRLAASEQGEDGMQALRQNVFSADVASGSNGVAEATGHGLLRTTIYWCSGVAAACAAAYAVFLYAPRTQQTPGAAPEVVAVEPTQPKATSQSQTMQAAAAPASPTIAAPFATEFRLDPFLVERPFERRSPFTFTNEPSRGTFTSFAPRPMSTSYAPTNAANDATDFHGLSLSPSNEDPVDSRVFWQSKDGKPLNVEPVGLQIQR